MAFPLASTVMAMTMELSGEAQSLLVESQKGHPHISGMVALPFQVHLLESDAALIKNVIKMLLGLLFRGYNFTGFQMK